MLPGRERLPSQAGCSRLWRPPRHGRLLRSLLFCWPPHKPSPSWWSRTASSPPPCACSWARSLFLFSSSPKSNGSSGAGSAVFMQYAFYQVIAAAVVFVISNLILGMLRLPPPGALSTVQLIGWFPVLFITFLASIYVLLKVPALTNHIFSGTAGALRRCSSKRPSSVVAKAGMTEDAKLPQCQTALPRIVWGPHGDEYLPEDRAGPAGARLRGTWRLIDLADHPHLSKLPSSGHPHQRPGPCRGHQLPQPRIQPQDAEAKYFLSEFCCALLPPQPLHHPGRFCQGPALSRRQARQRDSGCLSQGRHHTEIPHQ